jgi:hypothetical protein
MPVPWLSVGEYASVADAGKTTMGGWSAAVFGLTGGHGAECPCPHCIACESMLSPRLTSPDPHASADSASARDAPNAKLLFKDGRVIIENLLGALPFWL